MILNVNYQFVHLYTTTICAHTKSQIKWEWHYLMIVM